MLKLCLSALLFGLLGSVVVPVLALFGSLALFHLLVPRCGTPGDSGGCEMSAGVIGVFAVIPGFLIGAAFGIHRARRGKRGRGDDAPPTASSPVSSVDD
jgi:hypothetical protein